MKKRLAALALSIVLIVGLMPAVALAADGGLTTSSTGSSWPLTTQSTAKPTITIMRANTGKVAVRVGKTYQLATRTSAGKLTYKSSDKKIALVTSKGVVKAKKVGKTTVTITATNGSAKTTKKVSLTVLAAKKYKAAKKLAAKSSATSLAVGKTATVKPSFTPVKASNKNVTFKSSNAKVLTVSASGKVTAVGAGTAKITIKSCDNSKAKASVKIKVTGLSTKKSLDAYSWSELKTISNQIAAAPSDSVGLAIAKTYNLVNSSGKLTGAAKSIKLTDGTATSVRIIGFRHDDKTSGGKAGISFEFVNCPMTRAMNSTDSNEGGWRSSAMRAWLNSSFYKLLPTDLRNGIISVEKRTNNKGYFKTDEDLGSLLSSDKVWLLSMNEVYSSDWDWDSPHTPSAYVYDGMQYQLYRDKGVTTSTWGFSEKAGAKTGDCQTWWLRSPVPTRSYGFYTVTLGGGYSSEDADYAQIGVSPGFCI